MMPGNLTTRSAGSAILACVILASCGPSGGAAHLMDNVAQRNASADRAPTWWTEPVEAMPQHLYVVDGGKAESVADLYVRGRVTRVEPDRSFMWSFNEDEVERRHELPFNDPDAQVSTIRVTVAPEAYIDSPKHSSLASAPEQVTFALALDAPVDLEDARTEFSAGTEIGALLVADSGVFDYDPGLWSVLNDGIMLGFVEEGDVVFPALDLDTEDDAPYGISIDVLEGSTPTGPIPVIDGRIVGD